jgi:hypothetical protein
MELFFPMLASEMLNILLLLAVEVAVREMEMKEGEEAEPEDG